MKYPDISRLEERISVLSGALWNRQQKLLAMSSTLMYLEFAREHRLSGKRAPAAQCLQRANERYGEAFRHYAIQAKLEGKNENT